MRYIILSLLLLAQLYAVGQDLEFNPLHHWDKTVLFADIDKMQNCYLIDENYTLQKYDAEGNLLYEYSENDLGTISHLDANNPLQTLLYFGDYNTIIFLDRTLSEMGQLDLNDIDVWLCPALCTSNDNKFWIYDSNTFLLRKIDLQGNTIIESQDLSLIVGTDELPNFMVEKNNKIYLNYYEEGIFVFDNLGNFEEKINLFEINTFQVFNNNIIYTKDNSTFSYDLLTTDNQTLQLPNSSLSELVIFAQERMLHISPTDVGLYKIKKNKK